MGRYPRPDSRSTAYVRCRAQLRAGVAGRFELNVVRCGDGTQQVGCDTSLCRCQSLVGAHSWEDLSLDLGIDE